jgi:beta-phosphoglucomutase-like phosphatase (HAD superfamily)
MGESPARTIVVEDTALGIEAARAAGMAAIGFTGASHAVADLPERLRAAGADLVIADMVELPPAVERLIQSRSTA